MWLSGGVLTWHIWGPGLHSQHWKKKVSKKVCLYIYIYSFIYWKLNVNKNKTWAQWKAYMVWFKPPQGSYTHTILPGMSMDIQVFRKSTHIALPPPSTNVLVLFYASIFSLTAYLDIFCSQHKHSPVTEKKMQSVPEFKHRQFPIYEVSTCNFSTLWWWKVIYIW